jgi:hypothetical protein
MIELFSGLSARQFTKLVLQLCRENADPVLKGRPWSLAFEDGSCWSQPDVART